MPETTDTVQQDATTTLQENNLQNRSSRTSFSQNKDGILTQYKRTLGAFVESQAKFVDDYGAPFNPLDELIPDAHKHYYRLQGMRDLIQDKETLAAVHAEIAGTNELTEWD